MGRQQVKCHGDDRRFDEVVRLVEEKFGKKVKYIADVAGGQGLLSRMLNKRGYESEVIDPRGYVLKGVSNRQCEYVSDMASYYDLVIGLHPDEAVRPVAESALYRPTILVPCCNFWDRTKKLGAKEMIKSICEYYDENNVKYEVETLNFNGPKNVAIITYI